MKLKELTSKFRNKYMIRVMAGVLIVAMIGGGTAARHVYAAKTATQDGTEAVQEEASSMLKDILVDGEGNTDTEIGKEETVYVIADHTGKAQSTIVSEWLKNPDGKDTLEDVSDLKGIDNVKGEETFEQKGNVLEWKANGSDIYYQGTTDKQTPVTVDISYFLDGKAIDAKDLAGKSGKATIRFDYTNHEKQGDVYVPFAAVSGMVLDERFSNVQVTNGKVVSNGDADIVMGFALPGLKESLQGDDGKLAEDVSIPDYVEVTADVEDFELEMTMTVVTGIAEFIGDKSFDFSSLDEKMDDLTDAMEQMKDGSGELAGGLDTLQEKMGEFSDGTDALQGGLSSYTGGTQTLADGIGLLKGQSSVLVNGVSELSSSVGMLNDGVKTLDKALNSPMGNKEKSSVQAEARKAAVKAVEKQFEDDKNSQSYNNIKSQAETQFAVALTSDANIEAVRQQAQDTVNANAEAIAAQAKEAATGQLAGIQDQFEKLPEAAQAAGQVQYAQTHTDEVSATAAGMAETMGENLKASLAPTLSAAGMTEEQINDLVNGIIGNMGDLLQGAATASVMQGDNAQAAGRAMAAEVEGTLQGMQGTLIESIGQVAVAAAQQTAPETAEQVVRGVAEQAKGTVGTSVADSVKAAAETAASQAAGQAVVAGAEGAKKQVAQSIEQASGDSGYSLVSGMAELNNAVGGMSEKLPQLTGGVDRLFAGSQALASKNTELNEGMAKLAGGKDQLMDGIVKLADGSNELADGIIEFDEEAIEKLVDSYNGDVKELADRIQAVMDAGNDYESFGGKAEDVSGDVKFIIRTEEIK